MFRIGLCSVTFRHLTVEEVIAVSQDARIQGIEWGGDIHVPHGAVDEAAAVAEKTHAAGLEVAAYGSYYRLGHEQEPGQFEAILQTAKALQAPSIRVWAGIYGSQDIDQQGRAQVVADARRIADKADEHDMAIHLEYHRNTLTDTPESTVQLLTEINHPNVSTYWQPAVGETVEHRLESIRMVKPWLRNIHVLHWNVADRLAFSEGTADWEKYLQALQSTEQDRYLLMEFVKDDDVKQLQTDVQSLRSLLDESLERKSF